MRKEEPVLLLLTPGFPANESDSTCLPAQQNFLLAFNKLKPAVKVIIISLQYPFDRTVYHWHGNRVFAMGGKNKKGLVRRLLWQRTAVLLTKLQQQHHVCGLLSFWCDECALLAARFSNKYHLPHYCWLLGQDAKKGNRYVSKIAGRKNGFIALSDFISRSFTEHYHIQPAATIPLGIEPAQFPVAFMEKDIDLLAAGSLIPLKQFDIFIRVAGVMKIFFPGLKIILCGDGPELKHLKTLAMQQGIAANISFTGELPHSALLQLMQRTKVFLHPSLYEGFGMVCAEALYAGAQVISFCKPADVTIKNWHIVSGEEEMKQKAAHLLQHLPAPERVLYSSSAETAAAIAGLFGI